MNNEKVRVKLRQEETGAIRVDCFETGPLLRKGRQN